MKFVISILFLFAIIAASGQDCGCANTAAPQKYKAMMADNNAQVCSQCAMLALYQCLCQCSTTKTDKTLVSANIEKIKATLRSFQAQGFDVCCPELLSKVVPCSGTGGAPPPGSGAKSSKAGSPAPESNVTTGDQTSDAFIDLTAKALKEDANVLKSAYNKGQEIGQMINTLADLLGLDDEKLKELNLTPKELFDRAKNYESRNEHEKALADCSRALKKRLPAIDDIFSDIRIFRAAIWSTLNDHERAMIDYSLALSMINRHIYEAEYSKKTETPLVKKMIFDRLTCYLNRAKELENTGQYEFAINDLSMAIELGANCQTELDRVRLLSLTKDKEQLAVQEQRLINDPKDVAALRQAAFLFRKTTQYDKSIRALEQLISLRATDPNINIEIAKNYSLLNNIPQAVCYIEKFAKNNPRKTIQIIAFDAEFLNFRKTPECDKFVEKYAEDKRSKSFVVLGKKNDLSKSYYLEKTGWLASKYFYFGELGIEQDFPTAGKLALSEVLGVNVKVGYYELAMDILGQMYENGEGLEKNLDKALMWYYFAAECDAAGGDPNNKGRKHLKDLRQKMGAK